MRLARDPDYLLTLFRKLAYRAEAEWIPLDPAKVECPDRAGIRRCFLLADHAHPPGLQVLLFELGAGARAFTQRLLHQRLFLHFLQRKGYLADDAHRPDDRKSAGAVSGGIAEYQRMRGKPAHKVVRDTDLIVVGHRCIKHDDTDALRAVIEGTTLEERVWAGKVR